MNTIGMYKDLKKRAWSGLWSRRILAELSYLLELSDAQEGRRRNLLDAAVRKLWDFVEEHGNITKEIALELEDELKDFAKDAKKQKVVLVAHAHIDMNWMWGFQETASLTVDTFETMLQLMEEYPQFTFSQSQASVYKIIEEYYPQLLEKIRARVQEGRWEITASTWVENDKNMSGSEAMVRHILYTKNYLSKLMGVDVDSLNIDFEPDTFGHNENMPELLSQGGVKYYYHCRGFEGDHVYRWRAPSGAEVIVYREPIWYNSDVHYDALDYVPSFCKKYGTDTALKLYGVGDHGGGPTRKDIERWLEMQTWPLLPQIKFGTMGEFYASLEKVREQLPVVQQELNYVFTGCYTSQARIKRANKVGEDRLAESEMLDAQARMLLPVYQTASCYADAWEKILFNQFHDILPGSGVVDTREYGMGEFQRAMAAAQINMNHAMREICANINTEGLAGEGKEDRSFGGGVGFGTESGLGYQPSQVGRGGGKRRIVTVFNPTQYERRENVEFILWDWQGETKRMYAADLDGNEIPCQTTKRGTHYWGHHYHKVLMFVEIPAMGYATYVLDEREEETLGIRWAALFDAEDDAPRVDDFTDMPLILENDRVKAVYAADTMKLLSFVDKETGEEKIQTPSCYFRLLTENCGQGMTAWRVGTISAEMDLNQDAAVKFLKYERGELMQTIEYRIVFAQSSLRARVTLEKGSRELHYDVHVDWHELGSPEKGVPQLNFTMPLGYKTENYLCSIPFGILAREELAQDVPCTGYMAGAPKAGTKTGIVAMADCKYGFRGYQDVISLDLLRSSFDPDPTPEQGDHHMKLGVGISEMEEAALDKMCETFLHPLHGCSNSAHPGTLAAKASLLTVEGSVKLSGYKAAEDGRGYICHIYNLRNEETSVIVKAQEKITSAEFTDILERKTGEITAKDGAAVFTMPAKSYRSVRICV